MFEFIYILIAMGFYSEMYKENAKLSNKDKLSTLWMVIYSSLWPSTVGKIILTQAVKQKQND